METELNTLRRREVADALTATLQWHDRFDRAFGVTASDCSDLLDWPGKTAPFAERPIEEMSGSEERLDWDQLNRIRGQVKFNMYKAELIEANPELAALSDAKIIFLMRSAGEARNMPQLDGGVIVADALWFSFASFCAQSLLATFPALDDEDGENQRLLVVLHFGMRALLYEEILQGRVLDKSKYQIIWETWPQQWEGEAGAPTFTWTALGRFIVAHELAHLLHHKPGCCTGEAVARRGILPAEWIEALAGLSTAAPDDYLYEAEADIEAVRMCANMLREYPRLQIPLVCAIYYMFLCLEELSRRVGATTVFAERSYVIRNCLIARFATGDQLAEQVEEQFRGRAKFYFDMGDRFRPLKSPTSGG